MAKSRNNNKRPMLWLAALVMVSVILYFQIPDKLGRDSEVKPSKPNIEKRGAGTVADYTSASQAVHAAVDRGLAGIRLTVGEVKESNREVPRQSVEGIIRWHNRQMLVNTPPEMTVETVKQAINTVTREAGGQILDTQPDNYNGMSVTRLDVGFRDKLAGDSVTIISDRVYITKEKSQSKPAATVRGELAIVIDDFGYAKEPIEEFILIGRPLTFAVLPYRPYSNEAAARGKSAGYQIMLHLPMEALAAPELIEPEVVTTGMSDQAIKEMVSKAINSVPGIIGVNNHQGSKATSDTRVMRDALSVIKANSLFFVDSHTNSQTVGVSVARQLGVRTAENDLFIDNNADVDSVKKQLRTAGQMASHYGNVVVIGHARHNTARAIKEMIPELESSGVKLVFISQFVK